MPNCNKCKSDFSNWINISNKLRNLSNRKFCLICSPFGKHNTKDITKPIKAHSSYTYVKNFRKNKKQKCIDYLGGKCCICGYNKTHRALSFHHLDPKKKDFNISRKSAWGFNKVKTELDKCVLLCANCHAEVHDGVAIVQVGFEPTTSRLSIEYSTTELLDH